MKNSLCWVVLFFCAHAGYCQEVFQRSYGGPGNDYGRAVIECSDGGYLIAGSTNSYYDSSTDVYLLRVDEAGDYLWGKSIGNAGKIEWGVDLAEDGAGNFIIAGYTNDTPSGSYDGLVIKTNHQGDVIWQKRYGDNDWDFFQGLSLNEADEIILAGSTTVDGGEKGWILKINPLGEILWEKILESSGHLKLTGLDICSDQTIVFTGYSNNLSLNSKNFVAGNINQDGNLAWIASYPELGNVETGKCICGENLQLYSVSTLSNQENTHDILINSVNHENGDVIWSQNLSQTDAFGNGITQKANGIIYFVGTIGGIGFNSYSASINSYGGDGGYVGPENTAILGGFGTDELFDVQVTSDGGIIAVGHTNSFGNGYQVHLCKLDSAGNRNESNSDFLDFVTSVRSINNPDDFKVYPNPAKDFIHLNLKMEREYSYAIFSTNGIAVKTGMTGSKPDKTIEISGLAGGLYSVVIMDSGGFPAGIIRFVKLP